MEGKPWYTSRTVWGAIIAVVASVIPLVSRMGVEGVTDDATNIASGIAAVVGGIVAIYGRYKAAEPLKR